MIANHLAQDKLLYILARGAHCTRFAAELFWIAGGFAPATLILDGGSARIQGASRVAKTEELCGYARLVLGSCPLQDGHLSLFMNSYGLNSPTVDMVLACNEWGVKAITRTSFEFPKSASPDHPARHPTERSLRKIANPATNSLALAGGAVMEVESFPHKISAVSRLGEVFILQMIVRSVLEQPIQVRIRPRLAGALVRAPAGMNGTESSS